MYITGKRPLLSTFILGVAVIKIIAAALEAVIRLVVNRQTDMAPDMMDILLWRVQMGSSFLQIVMICLIFLRLWGKLKRYLSIVSEDDMRAMGELQREYLGKNLPTLSASSVSRLLQIWAVIFIGAETVYAFIAILYRRFIAMLMDALSQGTAMTDGTFVMLYNMTHGFKYVEILTAILLGVIMTAIFLQDRFLKIVSVAVAVMFFISFGILQMQTVNLMGRTVGIVWTSIIYHMCETIGLVLLSYYLTKKYKGI